MAAVAGLTLLGKPAEGEKCDGMEALVKEAEKVIETMPEGSMARDVVTIITRSYISKLATI